MWVTTIHRYAFRPARAVRAYTLIELVVVITILGVIAAIAGPRFFETQPYNEHGYADEVAAAMRYSQKVAIASGCSVRLAIDLTGYSAFQQAASGGTCNSESSTWNTPVMRSDGSTLTGTHPSGVNVDAAATLIFDNKGKVTSGATTLHVGAYTLALDAISGYVQVQ